MKSARTSWYALALAGWLLLGLGICGLWAASAAGRVRASFDQDTRILHRILSQRAEQHEAVLTGLVALERAGVGQATLSSFAGAMRARYTQIEAIERCDRGQPGIEPCTERQWLSGGQHLGGDLNRRVIEAAQATPPDRPIVVVADAEKPHFALAQATRQGVFSLWVDSARFAGPAEFPQADSAFELFLTKGGVSLYKLNPRRPASPLEARLLPRFSIQKALGSASQPFWLVAQRQLRLLELPLAGMLALLLAGGTLTLLLVRFFFAVREARLGRLEAQLALQRERARAEGTVKAVSDALFTCNREGIITLTNPAAQALVGQSGLGQPLHQVVRLQATLSQQPLSDFLGDFWRSPRITELPEGTSLLDSAGQTRLVEGSLSPLHDEQGQLAGAVLALRDLGPFRQRMLEALEQSERRLREHQALLAHAGRMGTLSEIAAGIAHELNQPLTAILSQNQASLRLLQEEPGLAPDLAKVRRSLEKSADQARRAGQILERLRAHVARAPLRQEPVDLRQIVENVRVLSEGELAERGIRLQTQLGPEPLEVEADAIQLEQVLHNLVRNAIEAMSESSSPRLIQVTGGCHDSWVWLEVRDFGPGIAPEILPHLFTPFTSSKSGGMGLGLSLSQTLVQGMGGSLRGENVPGGGASFTLSLPALRREGVQG